MTATPRPDDDELTWTAFRQSGILTTAQATALGSRDLVRGSLTAGRWRRVCRGIVATTNGGLLRPQQLWVAFLAAGPGAALSGTTALLESGVRGLRESALCVLVPAERQRSTRLPRMPTDMPPIRITRTRFLPDEHRQVGSPPRVITARAVIDGASWASSADAARTIIAAACQQRRVTPEEIFAVLATRRGSPRHSMINRTLIDVAGGSQALSELQFLELCRMYGFPSPSRQERRRDSSGRQRFLDFYWKAWRLHVEIDGSHHMEATHWSDDMVRQNEVWIRGDRVLRFPAGLLRSRPEVVIRQLRAALEAAGWRS
ncbi:endonuclease domain-containing protein [Actinoplanes rectilineatus]|uniref:endonuclease domain-containing protein n=1 Tax=Actinoplanes rectilineatus TaxID=113571 RepID=UPI0005F27960|nr:DUF559 domain-containing protein [Actinoplanes rectilineatus]